MSEQLKSISEMTQEELRAELEKAGLLKSTEWFNERILPTLLEDRTLREALITCDQRITDLEAKLAKCRKTIGFITKLNPTLRRYIGGKAIDYMVTREEMNDLRAGLADQPAEGENRG